MDKQSPAIITADSKNQKQQKDPAGFEIKEQAYRKEIKSAQPVDPVDEAVYKEDSKKKRPEEQLGEEQWFILRIGYNILQIADVRAFYSLNRSGTQRRT